MNLAIFRIVFKEGLILAGVLFAASFFYLAIWLKKISAKPGGPKKILIIDNAKIGDLICATPVFRSLKANFPDSHLTVLVIPRVREILQHNPRIDQLITHSFNKKKNLSDVWGLIKKVSQEKFSICLNLNPGTLNFILPFVAAIPLRITTISKESGFFSNLLAALLCTYRLTLQKEALSVRHYLDLLKFIGITENNLKKEVFVDEASVKKAARFLAERGIIKEDLVVGFCLSAGNKFKEWGVTNFAELARLIAANFGYKIIAVGEPKDKPMLEEFRELIGSAAIITCEDFSLGEVPALFKRFDYFISADTGPLYIANALDVPVIDILGPCSMLAQPPIYEKCEAVHVNNLSCWPCSNGLDSVSSCRLGHLRCVKEISPEFVLASFEKLMKKYPQITQSHDF